jgi:hypothetical protein
MSNLKLPSAHQVGATVDVNFGNSKYLKSCEVAAVKFTDYGKVLYDVKVPVGFDDLSTVIENIDSSLITAPIDEPVDQS